MKRKWLQRIWSLCSLCCLAAAFAGTFFYMKNCGMIQGQKQEEENVIEELEGTYCTKKSNSLDGVPIYANAGDTLQIGFLPEGKCCQINQITEIEGKKWMQVSYCGLTGWLKKSKLRFISDEVCYIVPGTTVYMNALSEKGIKGYKKATTESKVVRKNITYGTEFVIKQFKNGWGLVEEDGKNFWINMYHMGSYPTKYWKVETLSSAAEINLRKEPGEKEQSLGKVPENTVVEIQEFQNGWGKIEYEGMDGWVMLHYLTPVKSSG